MEVSFVTTFFLVKRESISYFRSGSVKTATDAKYRNQLTKQFASTSARKGLWRWQICMKSEIASEAGTDEMEMEASGIAGGRA